ncbi:MAG: hypothetical protein E6J46_11220 [Chloroflexi bacterium]|nr:MAG: hypothetical protein E6J46_11220 [Chloroflexota bacterium]
MIAATMGPEGDLVAARLARGCRCFAVWMDGQVAGYGWLTVDAHRRKGIFRSLLIGISEIARRDGLKRLWIGSVAIPAEKAVGSSGFQPALHFTTVTVGGLHAMRMTARDPKLSQDAGRVLRVQPGWYMRRSRRRRH